MSELTLTALQADLDIAAKYGGPMRHTDETTRNTKPLPTFTLKPGAFDDIPLVELIGFLHRHGLVLAGTTIEKTQADDNA